MVKTGQQLTSIILNSVAHGVRNDYRSNRDYRSEKNCW